MATKKIYDLAVKVGSYEKDGKEKGRYQNIGAVLQKDDSGKFMILETWFNPAGCPHESGKGIIVSMFDPEKKSGQASAEVPDDEIPF